MSELNAERSLTYRSKGVGPSFVQLMEMEPAFRTIAYFSMEIGVKEDIPTYAGGLGILAGDVLKSAADLGVPMVGITLLYKHGYFKQRIDEEGRQIEEPHPPWNPEDKLFLLPNEVNVEIEGRPVYVRVWTYGVTGQTGYIVPIFFLDTDHDRNAPEDRSLSWHLYGGDLRYRLCQEMILGIGGLRILRSLGFHNLKTFHLNEGHAGFLALELLREQGYVDFRKIKEQVVFTSHTPVAAGHDYFPFELVEKTMSPVFVDYLKQMMPDGGVSMVDFGLRYSRYINAVSKKHRDVSRKLYNTENIDYITNGVHSNSWTSPNIKKLFDKHIPSWRNDPSRLVLAIKLPDNELWEAHQSNKMLLLSKVLEKTGIKLDPEILTIGFARRAVAYKRADLIFKDINRLIDICSGKVQLIFAGKAHAFDEEGKSMIQRVIKISKEISDKIPAVFLEDYDMELAALLTTGVDVWLNTPLRPREASGTSGMKCTHNGVLNLSVLDGWWIEGWVEDVTGWAIGPEPEEVDLVYYDDTKDAEALYEVLERKVIPLYYQHRDRWLSMMKSCIALNASYFNTHRVVREYCEKAYNIHSRYY